jgi:hypothetical protein
MLIEQFFLDGLPNTLAGQTIMVRSLPPEGHLGADMNQRLLVRCTKDVDFPLLCRTTGGIIYAG